MGIAREQKLVIKHTFLEYVSEQSDQADQVPSARKPTRQRSWTEPTLQLDPIYEEVKDLFNGSDSSDCDENEEVEGSSINANRMLMPATPEVSPLRCPASNNTTLPKHESWKNSMPAAALAAPEYTAWAASICYDSDMDANGWWAPMPYEVNAYSDPYHAAYPMSDSLYACNPVTNAAVPKPDTFEQKPLASGMQPYAKVVPSDGESTVGETRTSVMLKGVPDSCTRPMMLQLLDAAGFFGRFNFVYLPMDFKRNKNLGYALINLVSPKEALRLGRYFEGFSNWNELGGSACTVTWCSPQQGVQAHVERYRNSPVMHESVPEEWRPLLLTHGVPVAFPPPTMKIKAPKLKGLQ